MTNIAELVKEARETARSADEYAGDRELWACVADALEAQAKRIAELEALLKDCADDLNMLPTGLEDVNN